jgi:glutaredoxin
MKTVTFYQSVICPRCQMAKLSLGKILPDFPDIRIDHVEYVTNLGRSRQDGVRTIPTMVSGDKNLSGFLLTGKGIRRFLESL